MDATLRAEQLTAHIVDPVRRERVKQGIQKHLMALDAIGSGDDGDEPHAVSVAGYKVVTLGDINRREAVKIDNLKYLHQDLRRPVRLDAGVAVAVRPENDINQRGRHGFTALHRAVIDADVEGVRLLLAQKAKTTVQDASHLTPLQRAVMREKEPGMKDIIKMLRKAD